MYKLARFAHRKASEKWSSRSGDGPAQKLPDKPPCRHQITTQSSDSTAAAVAPFKEFESGPCAICKQQEHDAMIYRFKLLGGLILPYILASLDLTIVATSLPFIASYFNKFDQLNWIVTAFTLTSTTFIPAFGQLADVFGRHAALQLAMFLMLVGSTLCAAAQTWGMLLLGRALQGTSSAGIMNIIMIILADKVSLKENSKNNTIFVFVSGVSYSIGPVIGGYLTDANWRYVFVISIPIAFVSHFTIYFLLRNELVEGTHFRKGSRLSSILPALATLDIGGIVLFIFGVGLIILGTSWGGSTYPWTSAQVLAPIVVGGVCFALFFVYEYFLEPGRLVSRMFPKQVAMLPYSLFSRMDTLLIAIMQFAAGAAMYSVYYFIGIYFTVVEAYPAGKAGTQLLYYIPGLGAGVYIAAYMCNVRPGQTFPPLTLGTIEETIGLAVLAWAVSVRNTNVVNGMMVLAGAGTGSRFMPASLHIAGVWPERLASAMSLMRFAMPFGGTLGLTIMGSVFNNKFSGASSSSGLAGGLNVHSTQSLSAIANLPAAAQQVIRARGKDGVMWAFIAIMPIMGISLVSGLFLGNVWIKPASKSGQQDGRRVEEGRGDDDETQYNEVIYVPYLYALLKGNVNSYKHISRRQQLPGPAKEEQPTQISREEEIELL